MSNKKIKDKGDNKLVMLTESGGRLAYYFINTVIFIAVTFLLPNYSKNPTFISVLLILLIFVFLPLNYIEYLFAEDDKLIVLYKSVFFFHFLNRRRIFNYEEIKKIDVTLRHDKKTEVTAFIIDITSKFTAISSNSLVVEMKDGKKRHINTRVYKENLLPILEFMQSRGVYIKINYPNQNDLF